MNAEIKGGLSLASMLAFTPFGLSLETIFMATGFTMLGALARIGFEIAAEIDKPQGIRWGRIFALLAASMISAATISVLVLVAMKLMSVPSETILVFMLIAFGYVGPTGIPWLFTTLGGIVSRATGLRFPAFNIPPEEGGPVDGGADK
jgi:hypothetical protein